FALSFFLQDPPPSDISTLSLHDALPICHPQGARRSFRSLRPLALRDGRRSRERPALRRRAGRGEDLSRRGAAAVPGSPRRARRRSEEHTSELQSRFDLVCRLLLEKKKTA